MRYLDVVMRDNPFCYMPLDEQTASTVAKGYGRFGNGTYPASGTNRTNGPGRDMVQARNTDAATGYVQFPTFQSSVLGLSQPQTWEVWVNFSTTDVDSTSGAQWIIGSDFTTVAPMAWGNAHASLTNEVVSVINDGGGANDGTGWSGFTITSGWHHHATVFNANAQGDWTYYMDGIARGTIGHNSGGSFGCEYDKVYYLGRKVSSFTGGFYASAAVYNYALTPAQLITHYQTGRWGQKPAALRPSLNV